jgi:hypothetical protein
MLSIIDQTKIEWDRVYIPDGRSIKAVKCMLDAAKRQAAALGNGDADGLAATAPTPVNTPKKGKAEDMAGTKRKRGKKARDTASSENDGDDEETPRAKKEKVEGDEGGAEADGSAEAEAEAATKEEDDEDFTT